MKHNSGVKENTTLQCFTLWRTISTSRTPVRSHTLRSSSLNPSVRRVSLVLVGFFAVAGVVVDLRTLYIRRVDFFFLPLLFSLWCQSSLPPPRALSIGGCQQWT